MDNEKEKEISDDIAKEEAEKETESELEREICKDEQGETDSGKDKAAGVKAEKVSKKEKKLEKELAEQKDKYLRLMAEYDNYRKRTAKQQLEARESAIGDTVLQIIGIYDNFERALDAPTTDEKYKSGVEMIFKQLTAALDKMNVKIIDPTGEPFDPAKANAVNQIEDPSLGENVVAQVYEKGVMIGDKVIRYPMVAVANP